jgi:hypothetical protein
MGQLLTCLGEEIGVSLANDVETIPNDFANLFGAPTIPPATLSYECQIILWSTLAAILFVLLGSCGLCIWGCCCGFKCKKRTDTSTGGTIINNYYGNDEEMTEKLLEEEHPHDPLNPIRSFLDDFYET